MKKMIAVGALALIGFTARADGSACGDKLPGTYVSNDATTFSISADCAVTKYSSDGSGIVTAGKLTNNNGNWTFEPSTLLSGDDREAIKNLSVTFQAEGNDLIMNAKGARGIDWRAMRLADNDARNYHVKYVAVLENHKNRGAHRDVASKKKKNKKQPIE